MIIACDVDDVLFRMYAAFAAFHNERYGTNLSEEDFFSYFIWEVLGISRDQAVMRMEEFYATDGFRRLPLVEGALDGVRRLFKHHPLLAVTGRPDRCADITHEQLSGNFAGLFRSAHHTGAFVAGHAPEPKSKVCKRLNATVILEDALCHAFDCAEAGMRVILFDRPWNQGPIACGGGGSIERVRTWDDAVELLL